MDGLGALELARVRSGPNAGPFMSASQSKRRV